MTGRNSGEEEYQQLVPVPINRDITEDLNLNSELTNTHDIGNILYTDYIHLFQISGMILLVAMIGAITLTFSKRENIKRQNYFHQIQRDKDSAVSLIDVESNKGVKIDDWD